MVYSEKTRSWGKKEHTDLKEGTMSDFTEIDALKAVDEALAQLGDQLERDRVLQWAWAKYATQLPPTSED